MALPNTKVEIAFNAGYTTAAGSRVWTDVSAYVEAAQGLSISRGRQDEISQVQPSTLSLTLDNRDGRFTPDKTGGAYYPNVKKGRPIRVTSTYNAVAYTRFVGYINEWPVTWPDSTDSASTVTITASSRMARLGLGATLSSTVQAFILAASPSDYWPLNDVAGSTQGANLVQTARPYKQSGSGTAVTFGSTTAPGTEENPAATLAGGRYLASEVDPGLTTTPGYCIAFATTAVSVTIATFSLGDLDLLIDGSGTLYFSATAIGSNMNDGLGHMVSIRYTSASSADIYVDGTFVGAAGTGSYYGMPIVGLASISGAYVGNAAHVAIWNTAPTATQMQNISGALSAFQNDAAGARIARYASLAAIPTAEQSLDTGVSIIGAIETTDQTPIALMQKVTETENGVLYDAKDGTLVFKDRDHRYNLASSFTLNATTQEVQGDLLPRLDDQFLVNDVTATGIGTSTVRVTDAASTADYGFYRQSLDLATASQADVQASAEWRVGLNKQPATRYPTVSADIVNLSTAQAALALAAEIGTRFGLSNLPSQAPASTADFFVEGYSESITEKTHLITFNTSPTDGYVNIFRLDDPVLGQLDSGNVFAL